MNDDEAVVVMEHVSKHYRQGATDVPALRDISLTIARGEFTALCGPSGSGKTTALNLIGALDKPSSGTIRVEGRELGKLGRGQLSELRRDRIGFVFQAYNLVPVLTAYENAEIVLALQGALPSVRKETVHRVLDEVGLHGMERRRPDEMSGGQQQRVAIARAVAARPAIILADEPTANVDSETAEKLLELMERLNREQQATFLFSTHDPRVMARARRLLRMVDGQIVQDERQEKNQGKNQEKNQGNKRS
jgi:putative ABC transport system ATP-binding protein